MIIIDFLSLVFLNDDLICQLCSPYILDPFDQAVPYIQLSALNIVALTGNTNDQIIAQCPGTFYNVIMPL